MAKTYAGYVKRDVAKDVNWSAVATSISDVLTDSVKEREQKKAAIDKESRELGKRLTDAEGSQHSGLNQFYLDGANSIQEIRRIQDDLLKKGQLSLRDYNIQRQNVVDGVDELLGTVSSYNQLYEEKMKKYDQLSGQDKYQMENIEGFSNFNNHQVYVNPLDGRVSLGKRVMGENGIMRLSEDPNDFMTISSLKNRLNRDILKYDWSKNLQEGVDRIGRIKLVANEQGVKTREGQGQLENYEKSKADWIDSMMQDDVHMGSMLSDWIGGYSFNQEKDGDEKTIQLIQDPNGSPNLVPVITKGMKDVIRERLSEEFDARVDKIEEAMPVQRTTAYDDRTERQRKIDEQNATSWGQLYYGTPEIQKQAADRLLASPIARKEDLIDIDVRTEPGKVILRYKDSTKDRKIDILDDAGNPIPYSDFVSLGNELHGIDDYGRALQLSGREDAVYNVNRTGRATRAGKANLYSDPETLVIFEGERNITPKSIIEDTSSEVDEDVVKRISDVFSLLNLPKPQLKINAGGEEVKPAEYEIIGRQTVRKPPVEKEKSLEITFPGVSPISIPEGENFQNILDKIIETLDTAFKSNKEVSVDEIKASFPTVEMFEIYNPGFTTTEESPKKRTIAQIMKEDDVAREEAVKIFKAQ